MGNSIKNLLWSIRHLKSALRFVEIGRKEPGILKYQLSGLTEMNHYYDNIESILLGGVILS